MHEFAGAGHGGQCQHVVATGAVLHRARTAGIAGEVAADRAVARAGRVRRPEQSVRFERRLQVAVEHAGFDDRTAVARTDIENAVHAFERHHHAAGHRHRGTGRVGAATARNHRHALCAARAHQRDNLLTRGRQRDRVWQRLPARVVVSVGESLAGIGEPAIAELCGQLGLQARRQGVHRCEDSAAAVRRTRANGPGSPAAASARRIVLPRRIPESRPFVDADAPAPASSNARTASGFARSRRRSACSIG